MFGRRMGGLWAGVQVRGIGAALTAHQEMGDGEALTDLLGADQRAGLSARAGGQALVRLGWGLDSPPYWVRMIRANTAATPLHNAQPWRFFLPERIPLR